MRGSEPHRRAEARGVYGATAESGSRVDVPETVTSPLMPAVNAPLTQFEEVLAMVSDSSRPRKI
ncbi:MAG: hypothetical protein JWM53_5483 [bacterium]|nr:hypothetical protein [bacterium]